MKIIIPVLALFMIFINSSLNRESVIIPNESIRFRIIPASNKKEDQLNKLKVKNLINEKVMPVISTGSNINEARKIIQSSIPFIKKTLDTLNIPYTINYGQNPFPQKEYFDVIYPDNNYEALVISLGKAKGDNYWCVLFPPLCLVDAKYYGNNNNEYKSAVIDIINKYLQ